MPITKEEVAQAVRAWCTAFDTHHVETILAMETRAGGFGFRQLVRRDHVAIGEQGYRQMVERFFEQMEYYSLQLEDLQTSVAGDIGLAWGVYREKFRQKGRPPERARIRFSKVLAKGARGWEILLYHRDIQPYNEDGVYPTALTVGSEGT